MFHGTPPPGKTKQWKNPPTVRTFPGTPVQRTKRKDSKCLSVLKFCTRMGISNRAPILDQESSWWTHLEKANTEGAMTRGRGEIREKIQMKRPLRGRKPPTVSKKLDRGGVLVLYVKLLKAASTGVHGTGRSGGVHSSLGGVCLGGRKRQRAKHPSVEPPSRA